eukprot:764145-Hanusia_phi.AAC.3
MDMASVHCKSDTTNAGSLGSKYSKIGEDSDFSFKHGKLPARAISISGSSSGTSLSGQHISERSHRAQRFSAQCDASPALDVEATRVASTT